MKNTLPENKTYWTRGRIKPHLGEVRRAVDLGYSTDKGGKYIFSPCCDCGMGRWVKLYKGEPRTLRCRECYYKTKVMEGNNYWKGGCYTDNEGYICIKLDKNDFFYSMVDRRGYIREHRLVMAKSLGRVLYTWEIVHHRNHIKTDNQIKNLCLIGREKHNQLTLLQSKIDRLEGKVQQLTIEMELIKAENQLLRHGGINATM